MAVVIDPEGEEIRKLLEFMEAPVSPRVLEIGAGDGRLTFRFADRVAHVTAIDPDEDDIARAIERFPKKLRGKVDFRAVGLEAYTPSESLPAFDAVILSWSL